MRIYLSYFILALVLCSCNKEKKTQQKQVIEIYSPEDFNNKINVIDTFCINETKRAKNDIQNGKIFLNRHYIFDRTGYNPKNYFEGEGEKYVINELAKLNIGIDTTITPISSMRGFSDDLFRNNCYQSEMKNEVNKIMNAHSVSLDTLIKKAERQYVFNHPNRIFSSDELDHGHNSANNSFEDFEIKSRVVFGEIFIYPKDYKFKKEKSYSYTTADFILMKDGTIKDLDVNSTFQNPYNNKFRQYFEKELRDFVLKTKWIHPKSSGIVVNSEMSFIVWYK